MPTLDISARRNLPAKRASHVSILVKLSLMKSIKIILHLYPQDEESTVYSAEVYSKALKRTIKLVHVTYLNMKGKETCKLYFSTDVSMPAADVLLYYHSRFQIEFLYRDGKQYTRLNDSQTRSENKLNSQFNVSLTSINIARVVHLLSLLKEERKAFSMSDIKTMDHNTILL